MRDHSKREEIMMGTKTVAARAKIVEPELDTERDHAPFHHRRAIIAATADTSKAEFS